MSNDDTHAIAALRRSRGGELAELAEQHLKHDLRQSDRDLLRDAASRVNLYTTIGTAIGVGWGLFLAFRVRQARMRMWNAFKAREKPTAVKFADGREEPIPDVESLLRPTALGDLAAYFFFTAGGLFVGGETGLLAGSLTAGRMVTKDQEARDRIDKAFRNFKAEALRKEADKLDGGKSVLDKVLG